MPEAVKLTDNDRLDAALKLIQGVRLDEAMIRAHVMRPENVLGVSSDRGRDDPRVPAAIGGPPVVHPGYALDVRGFLDAIEAQLNDCVAGYAMRLTENGSTIATVEWAKEPQDGSENWTPDTRMHVASLSKIVTAIAMTRLLSEAGIPPSTPIIDYLPGYWVKGPNVDQITFAELMTHTSGLAYGATRARSDFEWMKSQIAAGTTRTRRVLLPEHELRVVPDPARHDQRQHPRGLDVARTGSAGCWPEFTDTFWDLITIRAYASYVASHVFAPRA